MTHPLITQALVQARQDDLKRELTSARYAVRVAAATERRHHRQDRRTRLRQRLRLRLAQALSSRSRPALTHEGVAPDHDDAGDTPSSRTPSAPEQCAAPLGCPTS